MFNVPALLLLMVLSWILVRGVKESANANNVMVLIKVAAILLFVLRSRARREHRQLASLHAQWIFRRADRRRHRLLHLYRVRFGFDRGGRMP